MINSLSEDDRLVIASRYFLELSGEETAAALGIPEGTVKSRLSRALARLKARVEEVERKEFLAKLEADLGSDRAAAELAGGRGLGFAEAVALAREGLATG